MTLRPCDGWTKRTSPAALSDATALSMVRSSNSTTGSRLEDWLQASRRALDVSGYCWGVVSCFSIRLPITRPSSWVSSTVRSYLASPWLGPSVQKGSCGEVIFGRVLRTEAQKRPLGAPEQFLPPATKFRQRADADQVQSGA